MIIKNGTVFLKNSRFEKTDIFTRDGLIADSPAAGDAVFDAEGLLVIPGLIDIHTHGIAGADFCSAGAEGLSRIARAELGCGIAAFCPSSMTLPADRLRTACGHVRAHVPAEDEAEILGINLEGPFISAKKCGAQDPESAVPADCGLFDELNEISGGAVKLVTVAPEIPGNMDFIRKYSEKLTVSLGHSTADYETARDAFEAGAAHLTHTFNAMNGINHRAPGPIPAAAERQDVTAELICDGYHIAPSVIRLAFSVFGDDRIVFVSDSTEATGMPDGRYILGNTAINKLGRRVTTDDGTLAGSASTLADCFFAALDMGIPIGSAVKSVSANPARVLGRDDLGVIDTGRRAVFSLIDLNNKKITVLR